MKDYFKDLNVRWSEGELKDHSNIPKGSNVEIAVSPIKILPPKNGKELFINTR
jgi:hypothetical protein